MSMPRVDSRRSASGCGRATMGPWTSCSLWSSSRCSGSSPRPSGATPAASTAAPP